MLTVKFVTGEELEDVYKVLHVQGSPFGANFVMFEGEAPRAIVTLSVGVEECPVATIKRLQFADGIEEGDKLFFMHAIMFKLKEGSPVLIKADKGLEYLAKFGFEEGEDGMLQILSEDINLYYNCGGGKR